MLRTNQLSFLGASLSIGEFESASEELQRKIQTSSIFHFILGSLHERDCIAQDANISELAHST